MSLSPNSTKRWLREPLLHFLLLGAALFLLSTRLTDSTTDRDTRDIFVDQATLVQYVRAQRPDLTDDSAAVFLREQSSEDLDKIVDRYVREEVMVREAKSLGLEEDDPVVRQRLVSKLQFLQEGIGSVQEDPTDTELLAYFNDNREDFLQPALVTFSHVFFDNREGGTAKALRRAQGSLAALNQQHIAFGDGPPHGDSYHYQPAYVQRPRTLIANHFNQHMAEQLFTLPVDGTSWQGPLESPYGQHVVMITGREGARTPSLDEVRQELRDAVLRIRARASVEQAMRSLLSRYDIDVDLEETTSNPD